MVQKFGNQLMAALTGQHINILPNLPVMSVVHFKTAMIEMYYLSVLMLVFM
jgi:hypothetical protein